MIRDFLELDPGATISSDVCIVGGGPAGISLALALERCGVPCCLLESGGDRYDATIQELFAAEQIGLADAQACRVRQLGGASNHWGGWCAPLNPIDFRQRPWIADSGWPIDETELHDYYVAAQPLCRLGDFAYDVTSVAPDPKPYRNFSADKLAVRFYQFSDPPLRFATAYAEQLRQSSLIDVYLHANVSKLETDANAASVRAAQIRTLDGRSGKVTARAFVLACGAVENARLLLLSRDVDPRGLGNGADQVGRHFMQHPHVGDVLVAINQPQQLEAMFKRFSRNGTTYQASIGPSATAQQTHLLANCSATLHTPQTPDSGAASLHALWHDLKQGNWPDHAAAKLWQVLRDLDGIGDRLMHGAQVGLLALRSEQLPNPASRVTLSEHLDPLGQPLSRVDWQLSREDRRTLRHSALLIAQEMGRLRLGRIRVPAWLLDDQAPWPESLWGGCHHMGTTRMANDPAHGVVDKNCRVHGVDNLHIAGSSVFTTSGYANPTLTIVALALRLAGHLAGELGTLSVEQARTRVTGNPTS